MIIARPITLLLGQLGCCSGFKPIIAVPGPTVVNKVTPNIKKESPGADTQCQCLTEILYDVHHDNLILHELFIHYSRTKPETIPMRRTWKNQHCSCYNLSVFFEPLGGSPLECPGPAPREQRGSTCQHWRAWEIQAISINHSLNLSLRGAKLYICPRSTAKLGEGTSPRRWWRSRSVPGARDAEQRRSGAQGGDPKKTIQYNVLADSRDEDQ